MLKYTSMSGHNDMFRQQIWEFFQNDLDSCLLVSRDLQTKRESSVFRGGLNFTATLAIVVIVEMCSSYYSGREADDNAVAEFINKYFSKHEPIFQFKDICKKFFQVFRHGLVHNWSPKMAGVSMDFSLNASFTFVRETPVLNVPAFYGVVKKGLRDYEDDLNVDERLRELFNRRYEEIILGDSQEVERFNRLFRSLLSTPS